MASETGPIKVVHVGLGPIGAGVVRQVADRKGFRIVGAADIDPAKAGRDLGEIAGLGRSLRVKISDDVRATIKKTKPDVVVLCTSSSLKKVLPQMEEILKLKAPIVSTTEELAYPTKSNMKYARVIHQLAKKAKVAVLGTGREPGLRHGRAAYHADRRVRARRVGARRSRAGRAHPAPAVPAEDRRRADPRAVPEEGGRRERAARGAGGVGVDDRGCDRVEAGSHQRPDSAQDGDRNGVERVPRCRRRLRVRHRAGRHRVPQRCSRSSRCTWKRIWARRSRSTPWRSSGSPPLKMKLAGGVHGDIATASIVVNSLPKILEVAPGLHTMRDMPVPSFFGGTR